MKIRVGSRDSKLAVIQSEIVINAIKKAHPEIETELVTMKTTGDMILDKTLDKIGGKGLFVKELDQALRNGTVDITVHSFKDMPMEVPQDLPIVAVSQREDATDVLILPKGVKAIDYSRPIGCSSERRRIQLKKLYPLALVQPVRGNIITRLEKLDRGEYSGLVLAKAGMKRLGLENRIAREFSVTEMIPAGCQGILAVQARIGFDTWFLEEFNDPEAFQVAQWERAFIRALDGGCSAPVAAYGRLEGSNLVFTGMYVNKKEDIFIKTVQCEASAGEGTAKALALELKQRGQAD